MFQKQVKFNKIDINGTWSSPDSSVKFYFNIIHQYRKQYFLVLNSDHGHQFHQQHEQSSLTFTHWTQTNYDI